MFHLVPQRCQNVTIDGIHIQAPARAPNTDGIDPSGYNFVFKNCVFDVGDDCIAIKATAKIDPARASCENFLITDCTFNHGHGMSIGGQTPGGLKHLIVRNSTFEGTEAGIRMKAPRGQGGLVEDCLYENLTMKDVTWPISISSYYSEGTAPKDLTQATTQPVTATTPIWKNIRITNVTSTSGPNAGRIYGLPEMHISDIVFTNVHITADNPLIITQADKLKFVNSTITVKNGDPIKAIVADIKGLDPKTGK
jgi:polygalacturonase